MKKFLILVLVVATIFLPSIVVAGTTWAVNGNNHGGVGFSVSHHGGKGDHHRVIRRSTTIIHRVPGHVVIHRPDYGHEVRHRPHIVHRQEGRRYVNDHSHGGVVIVVPSSRKNLYYYGY